jgi:protein gp37
MGEPMSKIEWTDRTWNPVRGCSRISEGCRNCYAERMASRFALFPPKDGMTAMRGPFYGYAEKGRWTGRVELIPDKLDEPLRWREPKRVFVNSTSDLFHEALPDGAIGRVFSVMEQSQQHTFQVLTKRPARMLGLLSEWESWNVRTPRNVWLGVSVEDQRTADERIPLLLQTPAAVRFVSYEPALGPVDFTDHLDEQGYETGGPQGWTTTGRGLDWVIVGGESGPGARPCDVAWIRDVVRQCREAGVPVFVKQVGANIRTRNDSLSTEHDPDVSTDWPEPETGWGRIDEDLDGYRDGYQGAPIRIYLKHPKGGDPSEWPEDLRVREMPAVARG